MPIPFGEVRHSCATNISSLHREVLSSEVYFTLLVRFPNTNFYFILNRNSSFSRLVFSWGTINYSTLPSERFTNTPLTTPRSVTHAGPPALPPRVLDHNAAERHYVTIITHLDQSLKQVPPILLLEYSTTTLRNNTM
jgi:hypothetical protein